LSHIPVCASDFLSNSPQNELKNSAKNFMYDRPHFSPFLRKIFALIHDTVSQPSTLQTGKNTKLILSGPVPGISIVSQLAGRVT
jgi:hypothetical protein